MRPPPQIQKTDCSHLVTEQVSDRYSLPFIYLHSTCAMLEATFVMPPTLSCSQKHPDFMS